MLGPGVQQRYRKVVEAHRHETEEGIKPDLCDMCFMIWAFENLLKECREWKKSAKMLYWNER